MCKLVNIDGLLRRPRQGHEADDNIITPFKGRTIDTDKPIEVYRNLNRKGKVYSIRQDGKVVAHTTAIVLGSVEFVVNESGKKRAIATQQRNVHAFIRGKYGTSGMGTTAKRNDLPTIIKYHPFNDMGFYCDNLTSKPYELKGAMCVIISEEGVRASYTYRK